MNTLDEALAAASRAYERARSRANDRGHLDDFRALDEARATLDRLARDYRRASSEVPA